MAKRLQLHQNNKQLVLSADRPHIESDDLLINILSRLPVNTLVRFRCVCKSWRALISDSHLVTTHLRRSNRRRLLFSLEPLQSIDIGALNDDVLSTRKVFQPFELLVYMGAFKFVGSCNGLICLLVKSPDVVFVCNPSTGIVRKLALPNWWDFVTFYGFGYDSTIEDYKIVLGNVDQSHQTTTVMIFQLKTKYWRTIDGLEYVDLVGQGCLVNGALHWVEKTWKEKVMFRIMSYGLAEETFQELIPLSYLCRDDILISARIGIAEYALLFVYLYTESEITMWVMKEYRVKESWTKVMQIPTTAIPTTTPHLPHRLPHDEEDEDEEVSLLDALCRDFNPICILEKGEVLIKSGGEYLTLYTPNGGRFRNVLGIPAGLAPEPVIYVESLVSPFM